MRHLSREIPIHFQPSTTVGREAGVFQLQLIGIALAARGKQGHAGADALATREAHHQFLVIDDVDALDGFAEPEAHTAIAQVMGEFIDDFAIEKAEDVGASIDQGHADIERTEHGGIFDADHARTHHHHGARQLLHVEDIVAIDHIRVVEGNAGWLHGTRTGRDQNLIGFDHPHLVGAGFDTQYMGGLKDRIAGDGVDEIAMQLVHQHLDFVADGNVQTLHQVLGGDALLNPIAAAIEPALTPAGQVQHRFAQGFAGNGAGMHAGPTDGERALDQGHAAAKLGRLNRGLLTGRAAADDDEIVFVHCLPLIAANAIATVLLKVSARPAGWLAHGSQLV